MTRRTFFAALAALFGAAALPKLPPNCRPRRPARDVARFMMPSQKYPWMASSAALNAHMNRLMTDPAYADAVARLPITGEKT